MLDVVVFESAKMLLSVVWSVRKFPKVHEKFHYHRVDQMDSCENSKLYMAAAVSDACLSNPNVLTNTRNADILKSIQNQGWQ